MDCPTLALSATVGNAHQICEWWSSMRPMELIVHHGRFIKLQRHQIMDYGDLEIIQNVTRYQLPE